MSVNGDISEEQKAVNLAKNVSGKGSDVIEFSTGVKLRIKEEVGPSILIDIVSEEEKNRPEPPEVYIESLDRYEINFDDPNYVKELQRWDMVSTKRVLDALILLGTEVEFIPEGIEKPMDNGWIALREILGFKVNRRDEQVRYLAWVKHVAIKTTEDLRMVTERVGRRAGVPEVDVDLAQKSFPGKDG